MNTRNLPTSALLVAIGAGAVLIIGAFAHFDPTNAPHALAPSSPSAPVSVDPQDSPGIATEAPPAAEPALPTDLSPGLAEVIKLAQAHVDESVILAYIKSSQQAFSPSANEILYLADLGVSQDIIGALVKPSPGAATSSENSQAMAAAPAAMPPPPVEPPAALGNQPDVAPETGLFYNDLAPYGAWVQQADYGLCWQPTVETIDPNWTPYLDGGQWLYSDSGWYWQSDYSWGWAAFHYGRWANIPHRGWVWVPGNQWGPAWVAWRSAGAYVGWAALPPGVSLNALAQLTYKSKPIGAHGVSAAPPWAFSFIKVSSLISRNLAHHVLSPDQSREMTRTSTLLDSYAVVNKRIFNRGLSLETVASASHRPVPQVNLRAVSALEEAGLAQDGKTMAVYLPNASSAPVNRTQTVPNLTAAPKHEPIVLAENNATEPSPQPTEQLHDNLPIELPPLHYPSGSPADLPRHNHNALVGSPTPAPKPIVVNREWSPTVERPAAPAPVPRYDGFNQQPSRPVEPPRNFVENRPAPVETHPAAPEPIRVAPAPVATSSASSGNSKSGR